MRGAGGASGCFLLLQQGAAAPLAEQSFALDLLRTLLALGLVCALVFVSLRLLARRGLGGFGLGFGSGQGPVRVLQRVPLEPRRALYLIAVGKRVLLIGSGEGGAPRLIAELDPGLLDADPATAASAAVKAARDA